MRKWLIIAVGALVLVLTFDLVSNQIARSKILSDLKSDAPLTVPKTAHKSLKAGLFHCDTFNEGLGRQYMTCWMPIHDESLASLALFGPAPQIWALFFGPAGEVLPDRPGGQPITGFIKFEEG